MKRMKKRMAMLLAVFMVLTSMPAYAQENVSQITNLDEVTENGTETVSEEINVEETATEESFVGEITGEEKTASAEDDTLTADNLDQVCFNTGNHMFRVADASAQADAVFEADGSYTINIPEENPFFPYEVQFTYNGETTEQWFMTPDDTVEVGGHIFRVSAYFDNSVVTQMTLNVAGKKVVVYPEKKEFTNDGDGIMELSLLPLETRNLTVDLTAFTPVELTMVSTDSIFTGDEQLEETDQVVWKVRGDGNYTISQSGDQFNLVMWSCNGGTEYEMIAGTGDQLDSNSVRYFVRVNTVNTSEWLIPAVCVEDENGNREQKTISNYYYTDYGKDYHHFTAQIIFNETDYGKNSYVALQINPEIFENVDYSLLKVYEGDYTSAELVDTSKDITDQILKDDISAKDAGWKISLDNWKNITMVSYDSEGNVTGCLPVTLEFYRQSAEGQIYIGSVYKQTETGAESIYSSGTQWKDEKGKINNVITIYKGYKANDQYNITLNYYKAGKYSKDLITAAYVGEYSSMTEAQTAGAEDIKDRLFAESYNGEGYTADYSAGIEFSIFAGEDGSESQEVFHYIIKIVEGENERPESYEQVSSSTYVKFNGLVDGKNQATLQSNGTCVVDETYDSYAEGNYWTIFTSEDTDLTAVAPIFTSYNKCKLYAEGAQEPEKSGVSVHDFSKGPVHYTAVAEDGKHSKNYWLSVVKATSGTSLYVTSMADESSHTKIENGIIYSDREVLLDIYHALVHDIFIANMGTDAIKNISVELDSDVLQLDDYWTLSGNYDLAGYDGKFEYLSGYNGSQPLGQNFAKLRLVAKSGVQLGTEITGTLKIKSGENTLMVLNLTGLVGEPTITTTEIPEATKYVPYGTVIQNNNKYSANTITYELASGQLPDGMELKSNGEIYGIPSEVGDYTFTVCMKRNYSSDTATYTLKVVENTDENVEKSTDTGYELRERLDDIVINENTDKTFVSVGEFEEFQDVYLDGQKLTRDEQYTAEKGSTRITIASQTLAEGGEGSHTIAMEFRTKDTNTLKRAAQNYTVTNKKAPNNNGDDNKKDDNKKDDYGKTDNTVKPDNGTKTDDTKNKPNHNTAGNTQSGSQSSSKGTGTGVSQNTSSTSETVIYTVKKGDTLSKIALQIYGDRSLWRKIYEDNKTVIKNPNRIRVGQQLKIYTGTENTEEEETSVVTANSYVIKPGDTLWKIAKKLYGKGNYWKRIFNENKAIIKNPERIRVGVTINLPEI